MSVESWSLNEKVLGAAWGCCRERHLWACYEIPRVTLILPKDLPPTSKVSLSLPHVLHVALVQKCDVQVWELNVPLNSWISLSPVPMGTRWAEFIVIRDWIQALKSVLPAYNKNESLAYTKSYLRREFCHWCTEWLRGQEGRVWHGFASEAVS